MKRSIAICGAPVVGKTTLLSAMAPLEGIDMPFSQRSRTETLTWIHTHKAGDSLTIITVSGSFWHAQSTIIPRLLTRTHAIVYVSAVVPKNLGGGWNPDAPDQERERQMFFWKMYAEQAAQVGALWVDIPWIFVLNKVDVGDENPLLSQIPAQFHDNIIRCVATEGKGVKQLWQRVIEVVSPI